MISPIAVAFLIMAGLVAWLAAGVGGWAWVLLWPAASLVVVGFGYAGIGPGVFGKQETGRLRFRNIVVLFPFLLMTWTVWHLQRWLSRAPCWHEVAPGLYLGRRAFLTEVPEGVEMVVDLAAEFPAPRGIRSAAGYRSLPTLDALPPADRVRAIELVREVAASAGPVYVHCASGRGRSAVFAAAVLMAKGLATDSKAAIAMLRTTRSLVRPNRGQLSWLRHLRDATRPPATDPNALEA